MPPKIRKTEDVEQPDARTLFRRSFVLPTYAAGTDCSPAVVTEAIQVGHRSTADPFVESTEDLPGDRKRVVWAVAV